jgi:hypothetical protein
MLYPNFGKPTSQAQCLADCKQKCTASLDACKQKATNKTALTACQKSHDICAANCVNKVCQSAPAK